MVADNETGYYLYNYTDPDYRGFRCCDRKLKYSPEHYKPRDLWSQYTKYLYRLYKTISQAKREAKDGSKERTKLMLYGTSVYVKLMNSVK